MVAVCLVRRIFFWLLTDTLSSRYSTGLYLYILFQRIIGLSTRASPSVVYGSEHVFQAEYSEVANARRHVIH
jgi:hypothetical protein